MSSLFNQYLVQSVNAQCQMVEYRDRCIKEMELKGYRLVSEHQDELSFEKIQELPHG